MRPFVFLVAMAVLVALPLSGCLEPEPPGAPEEQAAGSPASEAPRVPEPFQAVDTMEASADPLILVDGSICNETAQCFEYPFTVEAAAEMEATLSWESPGSDLDLHLVRPDGSISSSSGTPPATGEGIFLPLEPGEYRLIVTGFLVVTETFTLDVTFA